MQRVELIIVADVDKAIYGEANRMKKKSPAEKPEIKGCHRVGSPAFSTAVPSIPKPESW